MGRTLYKELVTRGIENGHANGIPLHILLPANNGLRHDMNGKVDDLQFEVFSWPKSQDMLSEIHLARKIVVGPVQNPVALHGALG
ncbi:hypothetical protein GCM10022278_23200 [Allohahella marinimesophila]|uniref:Uncharacterized protein n=1 Tax=Allohahella marinimesophila TaxID=1054972 RepID=A0ABP7PGF4_9GAMM